MQQSQSLEPVSYELNAQDMHIYLQNNPFAMISVEGEYRSNMHHMFTLGLCRFGRPELYIHHSDVENSSLLLNELGNKHMEKLLEDGLVTLPNYDHIDGRPILFTVKYLSGAELYAAGQKYAEAYTLAFDDAFDEIFKYGICQIYWPDELNTPELMLRQITNLQSSQTNDPVTIH